MFQTRPKVWLLTAFVVLANVIGNFALSWGMKHPLGLSPTGISFLDVLVQPWVGLGILLLAAWTLTRITLLSWADLSFVLPVTSVGYVLNAAIGYWVYGESISWARAAGTAFILSGTVITGLTPAKATRSE
jgi:drug/metabolite transporter (DMT)-like permease